MTTHLSNDGPGQSTDRRGQLLKTAAYYFSLLVLGMTTAALGPTLPYLAEQTDSILGNISFLFTTTGIGFLFGALLVGRLYDRVRGHPVMAVALILIACMMMLTPLAPKLWLLVPIFLVLGLAQSAVDVGTNTFLVWVHGNRVAPLMNGLHFFFGLGAFLTPIIVAQAVLSGDSIRWAFWAVALLALPAAAWLFRLRSPVAPDAGPEVSEQHRGRSASGGRRNGLTALFAAFLLLSVGAEFGFGGWIFSYATASGLASAANAAYLTSTFWGALTLGRLLTIPISVRVRPSIILLGDLAGCILSLGVILLWRDSQIALWVGAFGTGISMASVVPVTLSLAERRMTITGRTTGWFFVGSSVGSMSLPWLLGQLFTYIAPGAAMVAIFLTVIASLAVLMALLRYSTHSRSTRERTG